MSRQFIPDILARKNSPQKIVALTAYDYSFAKLIDATGKVDLILVGDSLGTVVQGHHNTLSVTLDEIIYHCRCVAPAVEKAVLVADLPFMSYQVSAEQALISAGRAVKEGGVQAVKLEGGVHVADTVRRIVQIDIPVLGHVGLTPQSYHRMGGHRVQGRLDAGGPGSRQQVLEDALAIEQAGVFALVVEGVPKDLAAEISSRLKVPTIGIGAGPDCDGQILVTHDLLGVDLDFKPRFVKRYADLGSLICAAVASYAADVNSSAFPSNEHCFHESDKATPRKVRELSTLRLAPRA